MRSSPQGTKALSEVPRRALRGQAGLRIMAPLGPWLLLTGTLALIWEYWF